LGSLDYFEIREKEELGLDLKNNTGIVEIVLEDECEKNDYEATSYTIESSSISLGDL